MTASAATAATGTTVSLTFDNNTAQPVHPRLPAGAAAGRGERDVLRQQREREQQLVHQVHVLVAAVGPGGGGNDIGGKTVDGTSLTTLPRQQQISEICNDRQNLLSHGLKPITFAYPGGAFNATIESEVQNCGYGNARTAGSLSPTGPTYAETLPPKTWLALRAYAPTGQVSLSSLESLVSGAASHGGGWVPIVIGKVCSQTADPTQLQHLHGLVGLDRPR